MTNAVCFDRSNLNQADMSKVREQGMPLLWQQELTGKVEEIMYNWDMNEGFYFQILLLRKQQTNPSLESIFRWETKMELEELEHRPKIRILPPSPHPSKRYERLSFSSDLIFKNLQNILSFISKWSGTKGIKILNLKSSLPNWVSKWWHEKLGWP